MVFKHTGQSLNKHTFHCTSLAFLYEREKIYTEVILITKENFMCGFLHILVGVQTSVITDNTDYSSE